MDIFWTSRDRYALTLHASETVTIENYGDLLWFYATQFDRRVCIRQICQVSSA
jgi:hypothetical protein